MNRLAITLDDDLYAIASSHVVAKRISMSKAIAELLRRQTPGGASVAPAGKFQPVTADGEAPSYFDPELGIRVNRADPTSAAEDVRWTEEDEALSVLWPDSTRLVPV